MIDQFLRQRVAEALPPRELERLRAYLHSLIASRLLPPRCGSRPDWTEIAQKCSIAVEALDRVSGVLGPGIDAIARFVGPEAARREQGRKRGIERSRKAKPDPRRYRLVSSKRKSKRSTASGVHRHASKPTVSAVDPASAAPRRKRGMKPKPIVEFPEPLWTIWEEPEAFTDALKLHMGRHGDSCWQLRRAIVRADESFDHKTFVSWLKGTKAPRSVASFEILGRIEKRYRLPEGYFKAMLAHPARAVTGHRPTDITPSQRRRLAWHLPDDFDRRTPKEREEILEWVQRVIVSGGTDYRRFQALALRNRYAVRFPGILDGSIFQGTAFRSHEAVDVDEDDLIGVTNTAIDAPERLWKEMAQLLDFKTATLTAFGYQRVGVWGEETAAQKVEHFGLLFGALAAPPKSAIRGLGIPGASLTFAMLVFPSVWDWYLRWRERRRGFYTAWEVDMLRIALALTRVETGWLRQHPRLSEHLDPIPGLVSEDQIVAARANWNEACDICHKHCTGRVKEIQRVAKVHRDPFEPIMPILESESPVGEYRKIADEIIRAMPDERRYPSAAAEAVRSFLLIRFGLHTGLRQKNLRQMLVCPKGKLPTSERQLADMKVGELRWSERDHGWEVFIPSVAFKNANSSYFGDKPFRLILPNIGNLYRYIDAYVERHRGRLLRSAPDPGTFFVKTVKVTSKSAAYDQNTFFEAWRLIIQRYGIYNPYTGRGVIKGLLPHGPHNIRDVLATHILKKTGSFEQASYAIQDTPDMVAKHYGRFLPQDKAALAARILNQVWEAA
ncbi:hypothetical protein LB545_01395 [Mesorhizobium sp. BR1-1-6]|nr:hypothetical protein [Mesorhizobium sp. BR1-1-6]MBZ9892979.1 hypothetical protein [Mesorhizobium sp. BR1-1-6]